MSRKEATNEMKTLCDHYNLIMNFNHHAHAAGMLLADCTPLDMHHEYGNMNLKSKFLNLIKDMGYLGIPCTSCRCAAGTLQANNAPFEYVFVQLKIRNTFLNPEGHQNLITDSKDRAILLKG